MKNDELHDAEREEHFEGMERISERERLERLTSRGRVPSCAQRGLPEGGLFDCDSFNQVDLEDAIEAACSGAKIPDVPVCSPSVDALSSSGRGDGGLE